MDISGIEGMLFSIHTILASVTTTPELLIDQKEANQIATAVANVSRHYDTGGMSAKMIDWTNLIGCLGLVYGPRIWKIAARSKAERAKDVTPAPSAPIGGFPQ